MNYKHKLTIKNYKKTHIILRNNFINIYKKYINYNNQINILTIQQEKLKKENKLLQSKLNKYNDLINNTDNLDDLKEKLKLLN